MNDKTADVLQSLAEKLGTTGDYLWNVLLKQAPIYAVTSTVEILLTVALTYGFVKSIPQAKKFLDGDYDILAGIYLIVAGLVLAMLIVAAFFTVGNIATAILNPEYWALDKVLSALRRK